MTMQSEENTTYHGDVAAVVGEAGDASGHRPRPGLERRKHPRCVQVALTPNHSKHTIPNPSPWAFSA
jgi:hypothetical protein